MKRQLSLAIPFALPIVLVVVKHGDLTQASPYATTLHSFISIDT